MARNTTQTCKAIMRQLRFQGFEQSATIRDIEMVMNSVAGSTKETRRRYTYELVRRKMMKKGEHGIYSLNHELAERNEEESMIRDITARLNAIESRITDLEKICETDGAQIYD